MVLNRSILQKKYDTRPLCKGNNYTRVTYSESMVFPTCNSFASRLRHELPSYGIDCMAKGKILNRLSIQVILSNEDKSTSSLHKGMVRITTLCIYRKETVV